MYKLKINDNKVINNESEIPRMPFIVKWNNGRYYMVAKNAHEKDNPGFDLLMIDLNENSGFIYKKNIIIDDIKKKICKPVKSELVISE
jgi:hypothetical protein